MVCIYGATAKRDLTSMANLLFMALFGLKGLFHQVEDGIDNSGKSGMVRRRAGLRSPTQFWIAKSRPRSRIAAIQS